MNCATKVRFFLSNFWGAVQKGCFFYRFLVLRLHKKALIPRLFLLYVDAPMDLGDYIILKVIKKLKFK
ncbi:hypothetical protein B7721_09600 [Streptococcus oralis subsp. oralis]|uniref:Uncharacterized protein n=5 Tax=Streptococcus TaxID=1301 RepID=A0A1X1J6D4_STROR|nr:hypothetical protein HMPREF9380_2094 [Streptococcus sanguinis SK49]ORO54784.1 hypothetical protein B7721_09600 [Streptococcus oralis subsp. oralis]ORO80954.1 hypothetical protein B7705_08675 [Streptococcus oralis subsp. dentisani]TKD49303.1 hypothetical protein FBF73_06730 [Streptococcus mitis]